MFNKLLLTAFILTIFPSIPAFGTDGSSGCGPSWYVFKENSLVSSSLRSTTNGTSWPTVTSGMTFGTSNCAKHKIVLKNKRSLHFVASNYDGLRLESAQGGGQYIEAFAETLGCKAVDANELSRVMKSNYAHIFSADESKPEAVLEKTWEQIQRNPVLSVHCQQPA